MNDGLAQENKPRRSCRYLWAISMVLLGLVLGIVMMVFVKLPGSISNTLRTPNQAMVEECRKKFNTPQERKACIDGANLTLDEETLEPNQPPANNAAIIETPNVAPTSDPTPGPALLPEPEPTFLDKKGLNVLAFGGANTNGAGVKDRDTQAYPALLSSKVMNLAHDSIGPNYFSVCFDTSFEDINDAPDVILLEIWLHYNEGLELLTQRLRNRFPNSLIIFIKDWSSPHNFRKNSDNPKGFINFKEWFAEHRDTLDPKADVIENTKAKLAAEEAHDWHVPLHANADKAIDSIASGVGGVPLESIDKNSGAVIWDMFPAKADGYETLMAYLEFYNKDHLHLNEAGHQKAANDLLEIINKARPAKIADIDNGNVGSDDCHFWNFELENIPQDLNNMVLSDTGGHYHDVLELQGYKGWMKVTNPLTKPSPLYISYHIDHEEGYYPPEVTVVIQDVASGNTLATTVLQTVNTDDMHSLIRTVAVGPQAIASGQEVKVTFTASAINTVNNFRLSGYLFADTEPMEWAFAPNTQAAHARQ